MNRSTLTTIGLRAATCVAAALLAVPAAGCRAVPPMRNQPIPRLQLGSTYKAMVLRAYGLPKQETVNRLCYVGPQPDSLLRGSDGWMSVLTFDDHGLLTCQEFLRRGPQQGYHRTEYWISGDLAHRSRAVDLDRQVIARSIQLAQEDFNYLVTTNEAHLFVLVRRLPSENEPVVQWHSEGSGDRDYCELTANALPGRDEPLMEHIDGVVRQRLLLVSVEMGNNSP